jgi:hypothetical protein
MAYRHSGEIGVSPDLLFAALRASEDAPASINHHSPVGESNMNAIKIAAIALIIAGALGLAYGSFTYTKETQQAKIGPIELTVSDRETVNVPMWVGLAAIAAGALLLFVPKGN